MLAKLMFLILCVYAALKGIKGEAQKYPAGVSPLLCPNYPHCDNKVLGEYARAAGDITHAYSTGADTVTDYKSYGNAIVGPAAKGYPAGVSPLLCPDYPNCDNEVLGDFARAAGDLTHEYSAGAHAPEHGSNGEAIIAGPVDKRYPAGVSPLLCPNYPHCDNKVLGEYARAAGDLSHSYAARSYAPQYESYGQSVSVMGEKGYPAGVHPHTCPNYPYCGPTPAHIPSKIWSSQKHYSFVAPSNNLWSAKSYNSYGSSSAYEYSNLGKGGDRYPSGVDPHSCPNYPYCH